MTNAPQLPGVFHALAPVLDHYGYLAVAAFVFLEDFGVPVPGETILVAAAVYAGAGRLNVVAVAVTAMVAAVLGDNVGFGIGHFGGRPLVLRAGKYVMLTEERLDKAEGWFNRHGGKVVAVARFVEGLRQANGIVAGVTRMHWAKFVAFNALGAALWVTVWTAVGDVSGSHIDAVYRSISHVFLYVVAAVVVLAAARVVWHVRRRRRRAATADATRRVYPDGTRDAGAPVRASEPE